MKLKQNVRFGDSKIAILVAIICVNDVYKKHGQECTITSFNDSAHGQGSFHFKDKAVDFRTKDIVSKDIKITSAALKQTIFKEIKEALPYGFDILFENIGGEQEHFHLEHDPK